MPLFCDPTSEQLASSQLLHLKNAKLSSLTAFSLFLSHCIYHSCLCWRDCLQWSTFCKSYSWGMASDQWLLTSTLWSGRMHMTWRYVLAHLYHSWSYFITVARENIHIMFLRQVLLVLHLTLFDYSLFWNLKLLNYMRFSSNMVLTWSHTGSLSRLNNWFKTFAWRNQLTLITSGAV